MNIKADVIDRKLRHYKKTTLYLLPAKPTQSSHQSYKIVLLP